MDFLRLPEVAHRTGLKRGYIYALIKKGKFPASIRLSHKVAVWSAEEVDAWCAAVVSRQTDAYHSVSFDVARPAPDPR